MKKFNELIYGAQVGQPYSRKITRWSKMSAAERLSRWAEADLEADLAQKRENLK